MKLIDRLKTFAAQVKNTFSGWTIRKRGNLHRTWNVSLLPSVDYMRWKTQSGPSPKNGEDFVPKYNSIEHCLEVSFLSAYYTVSIYKETPI